MSSEIKASGNVVLLDFYANTVFVDIAVFFALVFAMKSIVASF